MSAPAFVMKIKITNKIDIQYAPIALKRGIREALSLKNPDYYKQIARNPRLKYSPHVNEYERYYKYDQKNDVLRIGRGCFRRIEDYLERSGCGSRVFDWRVSQRADLRTRDLTFRDYQRGIPEKIIQRDEGVVRCDTGFGKTILALAVAERLQQKTLIIVPKLDLLEQFREEVIKLYGFEPGIIQGTNNSRADITVATAQSLRNRIGEGKVSHREFGLVIVDECHLFVPEKQRAVVEFFEAKYRYGFTATDRRTDGQGGALGFIFGDKLIDKTMPRATPKVSQVEYKGKITGIEYGEIIESQISCGARNELIVQHANRQHDSGRKTLVLTKRVAHYEALYETLRVSGNVFALSSSDKKSVRAERLKKFREEPSSFDILLGTFSLLSTGVDIPALDTLIIAGDLKSDVLQEQSAGRILRLFEGKEEPLIIDIVDSGNGILRNQARLRRKFYNSQEWEMI